jgi:uncharacterized membrane protein YeaQ/YmgE (transglycosylase-associated protein family)
MGMGILSWVVLGGLAGWVASIIAKTNAKMGIPANVFVGILGAVVGGWIFNFFGHIGVYGFNLYSFGVALVGATVLLFIFRRLV